ncbi:uncharacterized protein LOC125370967 [Ricinus communis]|uniref:uncharacterized protein LOC125370967 n=1 Tax=Ricinus communis TaxID=3988 RepID=UPI00201B0C5D|nr:uncharacterized protein LOC125370967 [Ricinus communis]
MAKRLDFKVTNNMAEYEACLFRLEAAVVAGAKHLMVYEDSILVIQQAFEEWEVKEERLKSYVKYLRTLVWSFSKCSFVLASRRESDGRCASYSIIYVGQSFTTINEAFSDYKIKHALLSRGLDNASSDGTRREAMVLRSKEVHRKQEYPKEMIDKERYALQIQARNYISHEGVLYKRMISCFIASMCD